MATVSVSLWRAFRSATNVHTNPLIKTDNILEDNRVSLLLRIASPQGLQAVCVYCCQSLLAYEMQNLPPSVMVPHLKRLDESLLEMMEVATRLNCLSGESLDHSSSAACACLFASAGLACAVRNGWLRWRCWWLSACNPCCRDHVPRSGRVAPRSTFP